MADGNAVLADKMKMIKDRAENDADFRQSLLANPKAFLAEQEVAMENIVKVSAEYHPNYGVCILITQKGTPASSPAPTTTQDDDTNKQNYDFLDCHNF